MKNFVFFLILVFSKVIFSEINFEKRLQAQKAIEKVYYEKRLWPKENPKQKPPFEDAIPEEVIKKKVEDYLKKSSALESFWNHPITGEELQAEIDRMAKQTKDPETLRALFSALNNDPFLIAECLARHNLAERLTNSYYAYDKKIHKEKLEEIQEIYTNINIKNLNSISNKLFKKVHLRSGNC